jgi:hypothetical protein
MLKNFGHAEQLSGVVRQIARQHAPTSRNPTLAQFLAQRAGDEHHLEVMKTADRDHRLVPPMRIFSQRPKATECELRGPRFMNDKSSNRKFLWTSQ